MKLKGKFRWNTTTSFIVLIIGVISAGIFSIYYKTTPKKLEPKVNIENQHDDKNSHFINNIEIRDLVNEMGLEEGKNISLKEIEKTLNDVDFIKEAQVSKDLKGQLIIDVVQDRPIARIMASNGKSAYVNQSMQLIDLSKKYTARVLLITGQGAGLLLKRDFFDKPEGKSLFKLINHLNNDRFWHAQIAQIELNKDLELTLYTQVGSEMIEFGTAEDFSKKLGKLKIFYNEIIPKKGWNTYKVVKLQYKDLIVCK